jgi:hypothetical protein
VKSIVGKVHIFCSSMKNAVEELRFAACWHQAKSSHRCYEATHIGMHVSYAAFNCLVRESSMCWILNSLSSDFIMLSLVVQFLLHDRS